MPFGNGAEGKFIKEIKKRTVLLLVLTDFILSFNLLCLGGRWRFSLSSSF